MDSSAIPVFMAGPFPVLHSHRCGDLDGEVELDVALLIGGLPNMLAATAFPVDDTWERILAALASGEARLGVAGMPYEEETQTGEPTVFPSAYVGIECANGERLVLAHIKGTDLEQEPEEYARQVIGAILQGQTPPELGEIIED